MKDKITLKEFFESKERLAIHCNTEEKANKLLKEFDKFGKTWWTGEGYLENTCFHTYKDKTCYFNDGWLCEIEYYENDNNYKIYSFEDIIFEEQCKPKNLIPEIAKMLGVEIGEEFFVVERGHTKYKLDLEHGLMYFDILGNRWFRTENTLNELLLNISTIKKSSQVPEITKAERVILENLPKKYKWIARDKDDDLYIFENEPYKSKFYWYGKHTTYIDIFVFNHLFQFIKWEDDNAYKIEDLLNEK